ncbi:MAG: PDZ domain-containing protein [Thermodesulfobacteriota bacterium]|nr:PDZ domain-containing protein [Thermodesulfobacteriota bacterium]
MMKTPPGKIFFTVGLLVLIVGWGLEPQSIQAKTGKDHTSAWLGVSVAELGATDRERFSIDLGQGVVVADVVDDSPADMVDLEAGDVILCLGETSVRSPGHFRRMMRRLHPGDTVWLEVIHDGRRKRLRVLLESQKEAQESPGSLIQWPKLFWFAGYDRPHMGIRPQDLNQDLASYFGVAPHGGVLIADVQEGGPADEAGLKPGDILTSIEGEEVGSSEEARDILREYDAGDDIEVTTVRSGKTRKMKVRLRQSPLQEKLDGLKRFWKELEKQSYTFEKELRRLREWMAVESFI